MMMNILKRHTFFLLACCCVMLAAGLVGYCLSSTSATLMTLNPPATNSPVFLMARCTVYVSLFFGWQPLLRKIKGALHNEHPLQQQSDIQTRKWVMVCALLYELFIVQNIVAVLIRMFVEWL